MFKSGVYILIYFENLYLYWVIENSTVIVTRGLNQTPDNAT